jgi:uncharacterized protein YaaN involved in tellurite resistance
MGKTPAKEPREPVATDLETLHRGDVKRQVAAAMNEIDVDDSRSIIFFGAKAQEQLTRVSDGMLEAVRVKDLGPAGSALGRMVGKLRELDLSGIDPTLRPNLLSRVFGLKDRVGRSIDQYEEVRDQIDQITNELEAHKTRLLTDITKLDKLYEASLDYLRTLEIYIQAGRARLEELDQTTIPALAAQADRSEDVVRAQKLRDLRAARDDLERRVHDLLLTRQVTMQALPGIRLVQENDKSLIGKINSTIVNTVPLWRQQLARAITIYRAGQAGRAVRAASDLTNELLRRNAENLRKVNAEVRREVERGVFDIEAVRAANDDLIATINESLQIAEEGRTRRKDAERQLAQCEEQLKDALASAAERAREPGPLPPRLD